VIVTAIFHPLEGAQNQLIEAFRTTIPAVHEEPGCVVYAIHDAMDGTITMIEKWADEDLLDAHSTGAAVAAMRSAIAPYIAGPAVVTRMRPIPIGISQGTV
jgi:quinol monooxygenase YgiN